MKITVRNPHPTVEVVFFDDAKGNGWMRFVPGGSVIELPEGSVIKPPPKAYLLARRGQFNYFDA